MGNLTPADGTPDYTDTRTYNGEDLARVYPDAAPAQRMYMYRD